MDGIRWSKVLVQWVKDSNLIECDCENIEQCSVDQFYPKFQERMKNTLIINEPNIIRFLEIHFPHFEMYLTETKQIAAPDHFYIFSLLLYFSCVRHPEKFFQQICSSFDKHKQHAVTAFLKSMFDANHMRKEVDRAMIKKAIQDAMPHTMLPPSSSSPKIRPDPKSPPSNLSSVPSRLLSSDVLDSPIRPSRSESRISPPTPKTIILDERTRQLKELKAQLEAERYEKGYLEVQLKQLQDKNEKLLEDKSKHLKELRELKVELQNCNRENESPNKKRGVDHKLVRIERQLLEKEEMLDKLRIELETVNENNRNANEMISYRNTQIVKLKDQILELEGSISTLSECIEEKEEIIKLLRLEKDDLQNFIIQNRLEQGAGVDVLNGSFECLELSSADAGNNGTGSTGGGSSKNFSPENMACAVVDVQLKEKEAENCLLKRSLEVIEHEKVRVSGLVGQFFRLYNEVVGRLPNGTTDPGDVGFVEKMNIFKVCYETLFEEYARYREGKGLLEDRNDQLEEEVRQLSSKVISLKEVLRALESNTADINRELEAVKKHASDYKKHSLELEETVNKQKRDYLKLISEKDDLQKTLTDFVEENGNMQGTILKLHTERDGFIESNSKLNKEKDDMLKKLRDLSVEREALSKQNLDLNIELNSLKGEYDSITGKIDYMLVSLNEDHEGSDFSSWFEKMDDLRVRLVTLKEDKDRLTSLNMKLTFEKTALEKEISNGEYSRTLLEEKHNESRKTVENLTDQLAQLKASSLEKQESYSLLEKTKTDLEQNIQSLSAELLEVHSELTGTVEQLELCEKSLEHTRTELQLKNKELVSAQDCNNKLELEISNQQATMQILEQVQRDTLEKKSHLEDEIEQLRKSLQESHQSLSETKDQLCSIQQEQLKLADQNNRLLEENKSIEKKLLTETQHKNKQSGTIESLEMQLSDLQLLLDNQKQHTLEQEHTLTAQLKEAHSQRDLLHKMNQSLLSGFNLMQERIVSLDKTYQTKIENLQTKIPKLSGLLAKLSSYQFQLRLEKSTLEDKLTKMANEYATLQLENEKLNKQLVELTSSKKTVEEEKLALEEELTEFEEKARLDENKIQQLRREIDDLLVQKTRNIEEALGRQTEIGDQLAVALEARNDLEIQVNQAKEALQCVQDEVRKKDAQLRQLSVEHDELEIKCAKLEIELGEQKNVIIAEQQSKEQLEKRIEVLSFELTSAEMEVTKVKEELSSKEQDFSTEVNTVSRLSHEKELLEQKIQELATGLGTVRQAKNELQELLEQEKEKAEEYNSQAIELREKLLKITDKSRDLEQSRNLLLVKNDELSKESETLLEQLAEHTETITVIEEDRDALREEKCLLEANLERVDSDKESMGLQCAKLLAQLSKEREEASIEKKKYESDIDRVVEESKKLQSDLVSAEKEHRLLEQRIQELEQSRKHLEDTISSKGVIEGKLAELSRVVEELRQDKSNLETEIGATKMERDSILSNLQELKAKHTELEDVKKILEAEQQSIELSKTELTAKLESAQKESQETTEQIVLLKDTVKTITDILKMKDNELTTIKQQNETLKTEHHFVVTGMETEFNEKLNKMQLVKDTLDKQVQDLSNQVKQLSEEVTKKENELLSAVEKLQHSTTLLKSAEAQIAELNTQLGEKLSIQQSLESRVNKLGELVQRQEETIRINESQISLLSGQITDGENLRVELQRKLTGLEENCATLEKRVQDSMEQVSQLSETNSNQKAVIVEKDTEIHQLTEGLQKIKTFQTQLEEKVTAFETVVAEKDEIEQQLIQLQNEIETLGDEKRKISIELEALLEQKNDVDRRLIQQLQDYDTLNEEFLNERDANKENEHKQTELKQQIQSLVDENDRLKVAQDSSRVQLSTKEKRLVEQEKQMDKLKREMDGLFGKNQQMDSLTHELMSMKIQVTELVAKKDELNDVVEHKEIQEKALQDSMNHLKENLRSKQEEVDTLNTDLHNVKESLHSVKIENSKLKSTIELQQTKMLNLELKNTEQGKKIEKLEESLSKTELSHLEDNSKATTLLKQLEKYKDCESKMRELSELHEKERAMNEKFVQDIGILRAKLVKHRQTSEEKEQEWTHERHALVKKLDECNKQADEKIRDIRIEYEGKLEKMKEKMSLLYNDEREKTKARCEKDIQALKADLQQENKRFTKLEVHAAKLQQQLCTLNEKNLELMKENEFVKSKMRIMEEIREERKSMLPPPSHVRLCSNLKMEDEEGEIFNNTYLTDLKTGRMSPPFAGRDSVRYSELAQRNSMVPPHLRSSYLPQYTDSEWPEEDQKDAGSLNLDDSSTSLISRKKVGGTTSYKRPGPPTPSKKAGRLSFGGSIATNDFQYNPILKDSSINNNNTSTTSGGQGAIAALSSRLSFGGGRKSNADTLPPAGSSDTAPGSSLAELNARRKTPGKFKQMFSSTNLLNTLQRDENSPPRRRLSLFNKNKR
ncbi:uncharacterized protein LOC129747632 isoform X2 [Uranotaenia lowii]|uniref:uncharacterized protein LOC129747632 isoform X2 n=1 Tax=Uranotaenia lowii TaxID=190385 RepID=UPI00247AFB36|nr:uncharacterized protein LOC129747632 isoform X2 [Uranotaenia lowii]